MTEEIKTVSKELKAMGMQLEAATQHVETLDARLEALTKLKELADSAIVDQHQHIQQLQRLLVRYIA